MHNFRLMTWHANEAPGLTTPGLGYLRKEENKRIEERPGVSRWGHSDA
jgi:hypothetical protein